MLQEIKKIDVVIFGASGITGKCVVVQFIKFNQNKLKWAVAGRNMQKLQKLLEWASAKTDQDVTDTTIIVANCDDEESLNSMTSQAKVIINCCGPYKLFGEPVVKACIKSGTHHLDVSGETEYMQNIHLKYNDAAENKGIFIISACGFDCVAVDFGVIHFTNNFKGVVNSIESYMKVNSSLQKPSIGIGTWNSIVYMLANGRNCIRMMMKFLSAADNSNLTPRLKSKRIHRSEICSNKIAIPFPAADELVVAQTQTFFQCYHKERPVQYKPYFICSSFLMLVLFFLLGSFLFILSQFRFGRRLLFQYPTFFSCGLITQNGPSEESRLMSSVRYTLKGEGWSEDVINKLEDKCLINIPPNKIMLTEIFINDFGYGFTSEAIILAASMILNETDKIPSKGGVLTPGAAFAKTSFLKKLQENVFHCKILPSSTA